MAEDTWNTIALPVLEHVSDIEGEERGTTIGAVAELVGASPEAVMLEVERLIEGGYMMGKMPIAMGDEPASILLMRPRLTGEGCRVIGAWPSEPFGDALLEMLSQAAAEAEPEQRSKLRKVVDAIRDVGITVFTDVAASAIKQSTGFG